MNVRLEYDMAWRAGIWFDEKLQMNNYQIKLFITTNTANPEDQVVCMSRINYFIYEEMNSTIFINENDLEQVRLLAQAGCNITTTPEEPIDQVLGWLIFLKLNAILENKMLITDICIQSDLGDNVKYLHSEGESTGPIGLEGWWTEANPNHCALNHVAGKKNIVKLNARTSWKKLDLNWSKEDSDDNVANTVVFAQFVKNEDK